jgi:hypothetical protein
MMLFWKNFFTSNLKFSSNFLHIFLFFIFFIYEQYFGWFLNSSRTEFVEFRQNTLNLLTLLGGHFDSYKWKPVLFLSYRIKGLSFSNSSSIFVKVFKHTHKMIGEMCKRQ